MNAAERARNPTCRAVSCANSARGTTAAGLLELLGIPDDDLVTIGINGELAKREDVIADGELWGLIACHHYIPRHLSMARRVAAEIVVEGERYPAQLLATTGR